MFILGYFLIILEATRREGEDVKSCEDDVESWEDDSCEDDVESWEDDSWEDDVEVVSFRS